MKSILRDLKNMIKIYLIDIPNDIKLGRYIPILKKYVNIDINYKSDQTLIAWLTVIKLLYKDMDNKNIKFKRDEYNKPYLMSGGIFFNISHSSQKVAIGISMREVGLDIEQIKTPNLKIADKYFSNIERKYIYLDDNYIKIRERFYIVWTLKESYLKYGGKGLRRRLNSFSVKIDDFDSVTVDDRVGSKNKKEDVNIGYRKIEDYVISYCGKGKINGIRRLDIKEILLGLENM